jgi:hypothetical protein
MMWLSLPPELDELGRRKRRPLSRPAADLGRFCRAAVGGWLT